MNAPQPYDPTLDPLLEFMPVRWKVPVKLLIPAALYGYMVIIKPFTARLQEMMTERLVKGVKNPEDAIRIHNILDSWWYRAGAFIFEMVARVKLPTHADYHELLYQQSIPAASTPTPIKPAGLGDIT